MLNIICEFGRKNQAYEPGSFCSTLIAQNWPVHRAHIVSIVLSQAGNFMKQFQLKSGVLKHCLCLVGTSVHMYKSILQSGLFYNKGNILILPLSEFEIYYGYVHRCWPQTAEIQIPTLLPAQPEL